jgi:HlyD family secretion protein
MKNKKTILFAAMAALMILLAACNGLNGSSETDLSASGTISAKSVNVAPEVSGKIAEVAAAEGDTVKAGDLLFRIDNELLNAQYEQTKAAVQVAEAAVQAANDQLTTAETQYEIASQSSRSSAVDYREKVWKKSPLDEIDLPIWYFSQSEEVQAVQSTISAAEENLKAKQTELEKVLASASSADFVELEKKLAQTQFAYQAADQTRDIAKAATENKELRSKAEDLYDLSKSDLENAQKAYDQALTSSAADDVLEARAAAAVAQTQLDNAKDLLDSLSVGEQALQIQAANAAVQQAKTGVSQADANLAQAKANLKTIEIQVNKTKIYSPISGVVLLKNLEQGEMVSAGSTVMKVGNIDQVKLTVYVPEDQYGMVKLGQDVTVTVDSFPGKNYAGKVTYIADEAEFTPSNVQTVKGRKSTVFAVEITVPNSDHDLKSGMPADVDFILSE